MTQTEHKATALGRRPRKEIEKGNQMTSDIPRLEIEMGNQMMSDIPRLEIEKGNQTTSNIPSLPLGHAFTVTLTVLTCVVIVVLDIDGWSKVDTIKEPGEHRQRHPSAQNQHTKGMNKSDSQEGCSGLHTYKIING